MHTCNKNQGLCALKNKIKNSLTINKNRKYIYIYIYIYICLTW
jgi:hypothetical protein